MRFKLEKLLFFAFVTRIFILIFPWLTTVLLSPEKSPIGFFDFTHVSWARWDALHYIYLSQNWYTNVGDAGNFIVFFPLYPLILKLTSFFIHPTAAAGIFISMLMFLIAVYYFYKLVALEYSERIATLAVVSLIIFPTSYFFNSPYTESLFLLTFVLSFYAAKKESWILAGIIAGLGTISRPLGFLLVPSLLVEWFYSKKRRWQVLPIIILPAAVAAGWYLYLNWSIYGNIFEFQKILNIHWQKHFMSPFLSIRDSWKIALMGKLTNYVIFVGWAEALTTTISWLIIPFAFKYLKKSWAFFYTLNIVIFSSTSFILSSPRYLLSIPPIFVLLAIPQKNYLFKIIFQFVSVALLICLSIIFTSGQWAF